MLRLRRLYLLPAFVLTCLLYLVVRRNDLPLPYKLSQTPVSYEDGETTTHWRKQPERYPVTSFIPLPTDSATAEIPKIQHDSFADSQKEVETLAERNERLRRRIAVKTSFVRSWSSYKAYAWSRDELSPVSGTWRSGFGGWGATLVDSMDTLWIMGLKDEFEQCVQTVEAIDFGHHEEEMLNVFETTIRYLGGLLAAYDISGGRYPSLLNKAEELGELLYAAFDTPHRMPVMRWGWQQSARGQEIVPPDQTLLAEFGSLSLEFTRLSQLTGQMKFYDAVQRINNELQRMQDTTAIPGLWPVVINVNQWPPIAIGKHFSLGGMSDSMYEYLPKEYLLIAGKGEEGIGLRKMYGESIGVIKEKMLFRPLTPSDDDVLLSGNLAAIQEGNISLTPQGQHLTCFTGGMVALGARIFDRQEDLAVAKRLVAGCVWAYRAMPTGLMPETFHAVPCHLGVGPVDPVKCKWSEAKWYDAVRDQNALDTPANKPTQQEVIDFSQARGLQPGFSAIGDGKYTLRPEAIESIFILYRITADPAYRDMAWEMFESIEKATVTKLANSAIDDVRRVPPQPVDRMESYWLAETLKYFYLIFSEPELVSLDDYVLNTEAHPFRRAI